MPRALDTQRDKKCKWKYANYVSDAAQEEQRLQLIKMIMKTQQISFYPALSPQPLSDNPAQILIQIYIRCHLQATIWRQSHDAKPPRPIA